MSVHEYHLYTSKSASLKHGFNLRILYFCLTEVSSELPTERTTGVSTEQPPMTTELTTGTLPLTNTIIHAYNHISNNCK